MVLAGGRVDELLCLTEKRPKSALPIFGTYRIIDFVLSNLMQSGINNVGVLSQFRPYALVRHIGTGEHWDFIGRSRGIRILPPYQGLKESDWYKGTADAVYQNISYIEEYKPEHVLIASADHVYHMDYKPFFQFHLERNADLTICFTKVTSKTSRFGYGVIDKNDQVAKYSEKPKTPPSAWASMTLYLFKKQVLIDALKENVGAESHEFGRDIVTKLVTNKKVLGYRFADFWAYARTIETYYKTNMALLQSELNLNSWSIRTNLVERCAYGDRLPARIDGVVTNSVVGDGCVVKGKVNNSILSPGVKVESGAEVIDSIIFHDTTVKSNAYLKKVICDKDSEIGESCTIGGFGEDIPSKEFGDLLNSGITVFGKFSKIPAHTTIGANTAIYSSVAIKDAKIDPGSVLR